MTDFQAPPRPPVKRTPIKRTRIKICCIMSREEANLAVHMGADALGLVGPMPSGPGIIDQARDIARRVPPPVSTFLLSSETTAEGLARQVRYVGASTLQIVSHIDPSVYQALDQLLPRGQVKRVQVIHVEGGGPLDLIDLYKDYVDAFLLDSGRPAAEVPELGGTGRVHDWTISAEFVTHSPCPVFLAGGLTPDNVQDAITTVKPYGLDLCSGVRTDGRLDDLKLRAFMDNVAMADELRQEGC